MDDLTNNTNKTQESYNSFITNTNTNTNNNQTSSIFNTIEPADLDPNNRPSPDLYNIKKFPDISLNEQILSENTANKNNSNIKVDQNEEMNPINNINEEEEEEYIHSNSVPINLNQSLQEMTEKQKTHKKAKIKNIIKQDEDIKLVQKNALFVIGKMTEMFLQDLARNSYCVARANKRKTLNIEDICNLMFFKAFSACAVKTFDKYGFVDFKTIFSNETLDNLKVKEEKLEKEIEKNSKKKNKGESSKGGAGKSGVEGKKVGVGGDDGVLIASAVKKEKIKKKDSDLKKNNMTLDKMFKIEKK